MKTNIKESEIQAMNKSFRILNERRKKLLDNSQTEKLKKQVKKIREYSINHLDDLKELAFKRLRDNGIEVIYASDANEALKAIYGIVKDEKYVAKSKSNTASEIGITDLFKEKGIKLIETDLGDRIVQFTTKKKSSHPIGPAAHLNIGDIAELLSKKFKKHVNEDPQEILNLVRQDVLEEIESCNVGITGANSLAAEDGSLVMVHNEGNISLVSMLNTHIIIVGIDKLVRTIEEAISVVKLETIYATGKTVPAYMNVISSPSKTADIEQILLNGMYGASRVVVVLLDNGRSKALKDCPESLFCIGCGSCIVTCPIYNILGYDFGYNRYLGGRGVVFSRYLRNEQICYDSGLFTCTLCGQCTLDCPLEIHTNHLIQELRCESVNSGLFKDKHRKTAQKIKRNGSPFS
ncbi:MAG: LUD domain-containing protein [Methanobacterium sp.]|nr:LUD domain-containing protein [Methanobacterium sp.]